MELDVFIEQAEYIAPEMFDLWRAEHPDEASILRKLTQGGAKLVTGPRGCGKTTLMLKAYNKLLSPDEVALPIYVNFKRSLSLEPLYKLSDKGTYWFNQWVLYKIYDGVYRTLESVNCSCKLSVDREAAARMVSALELSDVKGLSEKTVTVSQLELDILRAVDKSDRTRCVLLLDDAAHAFSAEQQRDFFDFFRQIKTREISPKAAIYPGVTTYSSSFHVGHDAEEIDVWVKPDKPQYLAFMRGVIRNRFPQEIAKEIEKERQAVDFLCYAAFGIPRAFLNMLQALMSLLDQEQDAYGIDLSRRAVMSAVKDNYANSLKLFRTLRNKVPVFENFVVNGEVVFSNAISAVKTYNKDKGVTKQSVSIAINTTDVSQEVAQLFGLFQYAGLCIPKGAVSRGEKGRFEIFVLHYAGLIASNALLGKKSPSIEDYVLAFKNRDAHEFTRAGAQILWSGANLGELFQLSLPPCASCGKPRIHKDARFCSACGAPLKSASTYLQLVNQDIGVLPLTSSRIEKIKRHSSIRKIKDILLDTEHKELMTVDRIGPYWAAKIVGLAEEYVE